MVKNEILPNKNALSSPEIQILQNYDSSKSVIKTLEDLQGFSNEGILWALAAVVKAKQRQRLDSPHPILLAGSEQYLEDPSEHKGLAACAQTIAAGLRLVLKSNFGPGLFLDVSMDPEGRLNPNRPILASLTSAPGQEEGWYSKTGSGLPLGHPGVVPSILAAAVPHIVQVALDSKQLAA